MRSYRASTAEWNRRVETAYQIRHEPLLAQSQAIGAVEASSEDRDVVVCAAGSLPGDLHKLWRARDPKGYHVEYGFSCTGIRDRRWYRCQDGGCIARSVCNGWRWVVPYAPLRNRHRSAGGHQINHRVRRQSRIPVKWRGLRNRGRRATRDSLSTAHPRRPARWRSALHGSSGQRGEPWRPSDSCSYTKNSWRLLPRHDDPSSLPSSRSRPIRRCPHRTRSRGGTFPSPRLPLSRQQGRREIYDVEKRSQRPYLRPTNY